MRDGGAAAEPVVDTGRLNASASAEERSRQAIAARELQTDFQRARVTVRVGLPVWTSFAVFDFLQATYGGGGNLKALLTIRFAMALFLLVLVIWAQLERRITRFKVELGLLLSGVLLSASLALMCLYSGGFESFYTPGITLIMFAMITVPRPVSKNALWMLLVFAPYSLVLFGSTLFVPFMQQALHEPRALAAAVQYHLVGLATGAFVCVLSHNIWVMRRELYESQGIGRYRLTRMLGKGGMGEVWAAHHKELRREVAVKILQKNSEHDTDATKRFEREIYAIAGLSHPNIVRLHDYGVADDGRLYYAMELLEGETLRSLVQREGPLEPARAARLILQAASALSEAHERGIVHRDAKPENLFVTSVAGREFLKVLDFGIASVQDEPRFAVTQTGMIAGTPGTMSPEVVVGKTATPASDVYALGAVLYLLLTGQLPFGSGRGEALLAQLNERPRPPSRVIGRNLPEDVESIVLRCLEREPKDRFVTAGDLARALEHCSVLKRETPYEPPISSDHDNDSGS
ncbi:MAG TPA: serine/threonine-protein kinase, partial [Polyangiaceae bacterium]|nr:serine/threonine-protein kinase [Polyangiaceae bacterium]